jgi:hypothetical protein
MRKRDFNITQFLKLTPKEKQLARSSTYYGVDEYGTKKNGL